MHLFIWYVRPTHFIVSLSMLLSHHATVHYCQADLHCIYRLDKITPRGAFAALRCQSEIRSSRTQMPQPCISDIFFGNALASSKQRGETKTRLMHACVRYPCGKQNKQSTYSLMQLCCLASVGEPKTISILLLCLFETLLERHNFV